MTLHFRPSPERVSDLLRVAIQVPLAGANIRRWRRRCFWGPRSHGCRRTGSGRLLQRQRTYTHLARVVTTLSLSCGLRTIPAPC